MVRRLERLTARGGSAATERTAGSLCHGLPLLLPPPPACGEFEGSGTAGLSGSGSERVRTQIGSLKRSGEWRGGGLHMMS
jgi:hypothetical protein